MAGETSARSKMANLVSDEVLSIFGWAKSSGPTDTNYKCIAPDCHQKAKHHPTDVVFFYPDPYKAQDVYIQTDLKSYSKSTIDSTNISSAILSLGNQVDCAAISEEWQGRYVNQERSYRVEGMLFIFNNDGEFNCDFKNKLNGISETTYEKLPKNSNIYIFDPERVNILHSIAYDIMTYKHKKIKEYSFFYPNQVKLVSHCEGESHAASLETLLGPIIPVIQTHENNKRSLKIYYIKEGGTQDEFHYLLDFLVHFQQEHIMKSIEICFVKSSENARSNFMSAKEKYRKDQNAPNNLTDNIDCSRLSKLQVLMSETDLGMEARDDFE